ncbi:hypothetical protein GKD59_22760 [Parabacteroides distasonis]|uniref:Uncharacterized protein n=1 Tax=Parabacteroides distasonis TaxID=823 RepID=A0A7K0GNB8_PARDI|nr:MULTISPECIES: hypothetical protein [Bacteria]KAB5323392.1 hypothetical protein F9951_18745 [Bacteroides stercoris]MRY60659.1 hypothetical protein [Parabacteroides distasonis]MTU02694.1 hypothetical protein [Parasutterella excrementihominis]MTU24934.1 hypothetical protein [Parasutterella excrementihominis]MTU33831.1 hypothetical protein [Parasutterella excrementihominis]
MFRYITAFTPLPAPTHAIHFCSASREPDGDVSFDEWSWPILGYATVSETRRAEYPEEGSDRLVDGVAPEILACWADDEGNLETIYDASYAPYAIKPLSTETPNLRSRAVEVLKRREKSDALRLSTGENRNAKARP